MRSRTSLHWSVLPEHTAKLHVLGIQRWGIPFVDPCWVERRSFGPYEPHWCGPNHSGAEQYQQYYDVLQKVSSRGDARSDARRDARRDARSDARGDVRSATHASVSRLLARQPQ